MYGLMIRVYLLTYAFPRRAWERDMFVKGRGSRYFLREPEVIG